jgi:hypothetical protein
MRDKIYWEYAKLISRQALGETQWAFVQNRFNKLKSEQMTVS